MATTFDLSVIFKMIDKLSAPMKKMQDKFDDFSDKANKLGNNLTAVGAKMSMFVTLPVLGLGTAITKLSMDFEEANSKFGVVFQGFNEKANGLRKTLVDMYGFSNLAATEALAGFQDFLVPMGISRGIATDLSGEFVKLTTDIASFNNVSNAEVVTAMKSALSGMPVAMRRFGVDVSMTTLKNMALARGMELVNGQLTQQQRAFLVLEKVKKDSADAMGDFQRTQASLANQLKILKSRLSDLGVSFGNILLPIVTKVVNKLVILTNWFNNLSPKIKKTIIVILAITAAIGPLIFVAGKLILMVGMIGKVFKILTLLMSPQGLIILAIVAAIIILILVIKNWGKIVDWLKNKWSKLIDFIKRMPRIIVILIAAFAPFLLLPVLIIRNWEELKVFFSGLWTYLVDDFNMKVDKMKELWTGFQETLADSELWQATTDFLGKMWDGWVEGLIASIDAIKALWAAFVKWAKNDPVMKYLFETKPEAIVEEKEKEATVAAEEIEKKKKEKKKAPSLLDLDSMFSNLQSNNAEKSTVFVNVKVSPEDGSVATIDQVETKGKIKSKIKSSSNYTGSIFSPGEAR